MKKRILSLCMILVLCLSLLPATALAAAPDGQVLYVGGVQISSTGYWTTDSEGNVTAYTGEGTPTDNYIHYDADTNTLTLHNATIKEEVPYNTSTYVAGAAIGVHNQNGAAELTITLEGTNTIAEVGKGIYVLANSTGGATLTITGDGSLDASASQTGIWVQSNNGNGTLFIQNAKVETTGTNTAGYGVNVQSSNSSTAALTVDGGSLTASGSPGILYDSIGSGTVPKTTALTISNSAIVDARNGEIGAGSTTNLQPVPPSGNGIVFDGTEGTVYGDVTLDESLTIDQDETLTIPEGASLTSNDKLTNNGTIVNKGTMNGDPTGGSGTVVSTPTITTAILPEGMVGQPYTAKLEATGNDITWSSSDLPAGLTLDADTGTITGTPATEGQFSVKITATNSAGIASKEYTLNIKAVSVTGVTLNPTELSLFTGESATLTVKVEPADATNQDVTWKNSNPDVATVEGDTVTAVKEGEATIIVTTVDGGKTATCKVTVTQATYSISADISPDFGSVYTGYDRPAAQTVTVTNTGNQTLNLEQPASTKSFEVGTLSRTPLAPGEKATFTVQPKAGLAAGVYREEIQVSGSGNVTLSIPVSFSVQAAAAPQVTPAPAATPAPSDNITYYTCPSCGYHNWTATEAGYRCDHCGYLESTRQLSGYGNVKGSYTPGSSATSTAASTIPQTGDESNPVLWTVLLLVSGLALGGLALRRKTEHSRS